MVHGFLAVVPWILFAVLFVLATLIALAIRATGRKVTRDDILILFTKSIGAFLMAMAGGLLASVIQDQYTESPGWFKNIVSAITAMAAAALTWKFGKARIR